MSGDLEAADLTLAYAIRAVARVLVPVAADLRAASADGAPRYLLDHLRSDKPLSSSDREYLADLLAGLVSRPAGRPENSRIKARRRALEREFRRIRETGGSPAQAWMYLAAREIDQLGDAAFAEYGFSPDHGDVRDLADRFAEWSRRPASRK